MEKNNTETKKFPIHLGIIMDGNRRYAKQKGMDSWKGHEYGEKKFEEVLEWCKEYGLKELTLYTFSLQNFNRPKIEFDYLMKLFVEGSKKLLVDKRLDEYSIKVKFIGRTELFSEVIQDLMKQIEQKTKDNTEYKINFAMGYGGREEIVDATKRIAQMVKEGTLNPKDITEELVSDNLYMKDEPDLIIRTSGEKRTSNFLIWQSNYSEWCFVDKFWPEFSKEDFLACLEDYESRDRRKGK